MALATPFLPFLPLAAKQILLNNFLSDVPSIAISTDNVDPEQVARAERWNLREVRRFMVVFGLVSTAFDLLTFALLLAVFRATKAEFQSAWFLVSLLTELAVVLVLRTRGPAWRSRPGRLLGWTTAAALVATLGLPYVPGVGGAFELVPLPPPLVAASLAIVVGYVRRHRGGQALVLSADPRPRRNRPDDGAEAGPRPREGGRVESSGSTRGGPLLHPRKLLVVAAAGDDGDEPRRGTDRPKRRALGGTDRRALAGLARRRPHRGAPRRHAREVQRRRRRSAGIDARRRVPRAASARTSSDRPRRRGSCPTSDAAPP